jgi:uncharacterized membrane protein
MPWDWPFMWFPLLPIVFVLACFLIMFSVMMPMMRRRHDRSDQPTALDILDTRFARGEIDRAEYDEKRRILAGR